MILGPDEVRTLLRECVTVVKPGELLVLRVPGYTPEQVQLTQEVVCRWLENNGLDVKVLVASADEIAVAEPGLAS